MKRMRKKPPLAVLIIALFLMAGCSQGDESIPSGHLDLKDVGPALDSVPFDYSIKRVKPPAGDSVAFIGTVHGPFHTKMEFSIGLGEKATAVPVPVPGAGIREAVWETGFGFVYNDDDGVRSKFHSEAQWKEVSKMSVAVLESLCEAASGDPCPV